MDGVDGADVVAAGADEVGADAAVCRECGKGVPLCRPLDYADRAEGSGRLPWSGE